MYTQKLYKSGNSVAVTIPKQILTQLNLKEGEEVVLATKGKNLILGSKKQHLVGDVDEKFMKMVEEFADDHEDVLEELANR